MFGVSTVFALAQELEKSLKFAERQVAIFDPTQVLKEMVRFEQKAFQIFLGGLAEAEKGAWNFIDEDGPDPLTKLLSKMGPNFFCKGARKF